MPTENGSLKMKNVRVKFLTCRYGELDECVNGWLSKNADCEIHGIEHITVHTGVDTYFSVMIAYSEPIPETEVLYG